MPNEDQTNGEQRLGGFGGFEIPPSGRDLGWEKKFPQGKWEETEARRANIRPVKQGEVC